MVDSPEGEQITDMIDSEKPAKEIYDYIDQVVMKHVSVELINKAVDSIKKYSYEEGRRDLSNEFKKLMHLR